MIGGPGIVAGLDVGSTKTCAVLLAPDGPDGQGSRVVGVGLAASDGIRREEVTNLEATAGSIREALEEAEVMAGREAETVFAGLSGGHVSVEVSAGVVAVGGEAIRSADVERVHEVGRAVVIPPDRELLHAIPQEYSVDGRGGIQDPVGMAGTRLEADVCIVTASRTACRDLRRAVDRAGYRVEELVLDPLASASAVLRDGEREVGMALVEVGGASTDVAVFRDGKLLHLRSFGWGGEAITGDVVKGLGVPLDEAERLLRSHGTALTDRVEPGEEIEVPGPTAGSRRTVSRELLAHIVEQRLDEILGLVYDDLAEGGMREEIPGGVVLTGGVASLPGAAELAQRVFNAPVRVGAPGDGLAGLVDAVRKPKFATGVGLALYGREREATGRGPAGRAFARVTEWLMEFF